MSLRPLLLATMTFVLSTGCANKPASSPSEPSNEPGTAAPAQPTQAAQPPSEPGSGAAPTDTAQGSQPQTGTAASQPTVYKVQISGVRCIAAPCPTHLATPVNNPTGDSIHIHEIDFAALNLPQERLDALNRRMEKGNITVEATLGTRPNAGPAGAATVLKVSKVIDPQ